MNKLSNNPGRCGYHSGSPESGFSLLVSLVILAVIGAAALSIQENYAAKLKINQMVDEKSGRPELKEYLASLIGSPERPGNYFRFNNVFYTYKNFGSDVVVPRYPECTTATETSPSSIRVDSVPEIKQDGTTNFGRFYVRARCVNNSQYRIESKPKGSQDAWTILYTDTVAE